MFISHALCTRLTVAVCWDFCLQFNISFRVGLVDKVSEVPAHYSEGPLFRRSTIWVNVRVRVRVIRVRG